MRIDLRIKNREDGVVEHILLYPDVGHYIIVDLDNDETFSLSSIVSPEMMEARVRNLKGHDILVEKFDEDHENCDEVIEGRLVEVAFDLHSSTLQYSGGIA